MWKCSECYRVNMDDQKTCKCKQVESKSASVTGYASLYNKHNENLVWLIGELAFLNVTQKPLNDEKYNKAFKMLEILRQDLYGEEA